MVRNHMSIKISVSCALAMFLVLTTAFAESIINDSLQSWFYSGRDVSMSRDQYFESVVGGTVEAASQKDFHYSLTNFPVLLGNFSTLDIEKFIVTSGFPENFELEIESDLKSVDNNLFEEIQIDGKQVLKASVLYYKQSNLTPHAAGYYFHTSNQSYANFLFQFANVYHTKDTPYYQEIRQRAKPTHNILPNQKGNKPIIKGENITFYHLDRNDGYIETYGFRKPKGNELKGVEQILVLQAIYPAAQMAELAGPLTELFVKEVQQHQAVWGY